MLKLSDAANVYDISLQISNA